MLRANLATYSHFFLETRQYLAFGRGILKHPPEILNEQAIQMNLDDITAAIERADEASRLGDIEYMESVWWRATEADENLFSLEHR